jgi:hypothetical protein
MNILKHEHPYPIAHLSISKTEHEVMPLLRADAFGLISWGRSMRSEADATAFAIAVGLINLKILKLNAGAHVWAEKLAQSNQMKHSCSMCSDYGENLWMVMMRSRCTYGTTLCLPLAQESQNLL